MSNLIRIFVAVTIGDKLVDKIHRTQSRLKKLAPGLKWVSPDNFHLTVKFLGEIPENTLDDVFSAVAEAASEAKCFDLAFKGVGVFGNPVNPRVVWASISEGSKEMADLASSVESRLAKCGFPEEDRPFKAHLTLARSGREDKKQSEQFRAAIKDGADLQFGSVRVDSVVVMQSELRPTGSKYTPLKIFSFGVSEES